MTALPTHWTWAHAQLSQNLTKEILILLNLINRAYNKRKRGEHTHNSLGYGWWQVCI